MSRLASCFSALQQRQRKALITFVTAGDPDLAVTEQVMHRLVAAGADVIELGVPFSDPMADGPVIQRASERALKNGVSLRDVLGLVARFREQNQGVPIVLMGYLNPIERFGYQEFALAAAKAGVDGVLTVDMPLEEADEYRACLAEQGLDSVFLVAPTSGIERSRRIAAAASGFLYYVSVKGVTGGATADFSQVSQVVETLHQQSSIPVGVGFGISTAEDAATVAGFADAVVVGSAIIKELEKQGNQAGVDAAAALVGELRSAMDSRSGGDS